MTYDGHTDRVIYRSKFHASLKRNYQRSHTMRIIAVINEKAVIRRILKHLRLWNPLPGYPEYPIRDPPRPDGETIPLTWHPVPDIARESRQRIRMHVYS